MKSISPSFDLMEMATDDRIRAIPSKYLRYPNDMFLSLTNTIDQPL